MPERATSSLTPYRFIAGILAATAILAVLLAFASPSNAELRRLDLVVAGAFATLAVSSRLLLPRIRGDWGLDALLVLVILTAGYGMLLVVNAESQVLIGLGLVLFAVFSAYFRPWPRLAALLLVLVSVYLAGALINDLTGTPIVPLAVVVVIVGASVMVSFLAGELNRLALTDPLTGALNRRGLDIAAERVRASTARTGIPVTVGLVDLDRFKDFNDRCGHRAGDSMLVGVANAWWEALERDQVLARYGGDEFAVVLPGLNPEQARELASRVTRPPGGSWTVGFCLWDRGYDLDDALAYADQAMFRAKRGV
ncbi:MAG: hypothetical protein QG671_4258 [Actinomycetota bacterium]|nr:hypothetical protein [Actinomycetota bacterium]